jgi:uncharacterized Tic20 family protein
MQQITTDKNEIKQGKAAHELFTVNILLVHLFLSVAILKFGDANLAINVPIVVSLLIIIWTYFKNKNISKDASCFVKVNWQISLNRYKYLIISYILYAVIITIGYFVSLDAPASMDGTNIVYTIFTRLSVIPLFITVLVLAIAGSGSLFNSGKGEVPAKEVEKYC